MLLSERERDVLRRLQQNPGLTARDLAADMELSPRTVERYLRELQEKGRVQRIGATKKGFWQVTT